MVRAQATQAALLALHTSRVAQDQAQSWTGALGVRPFRSKLCLLVQLHMLLRQCSQQRRKGLVKVGQYLNRPLLETVLAGLLLLQQVLLETAMVAHPLAQAHNATAAAEEHWQQ